MLSQEGMGIIEAAVEQERRESAYRVQPLNTSVVYKNGKFCDSNYSVMAGLEPIEVMQAALTPEEFVGFLKGNVIKYSMRARHKQGKSAKKDIAKAKRYAEWLVKLDLKMPIKP